MDPQAPAPPQVPAEPPAPVEPAAQVSTDDGSIQQIVSSINDSKNVLVTVGTNPSVDALASALGLTFMLGKVGKHVTAVFSGKIPPAMEFLDPEKTFENTVDSLRDFIIALDKEKADKLRYKVEGDVVKIFITPYKTVITNKDLMFSQGDFNVDAVIALGVRQKEELDKSITAHGRILHDATVIAINAGNQKSNIATIDWNSPDASSVAEMLVNLSAQLGTDLLDSQTSTAFLTGIVAETNRFSNEKTSPKVMTMSAQLMAAGANQQLIATNLRQEGMISEPVRAKKNDQPNDDGGEMVLEHGAGKSQQNAKNTSVTKNEPKSKPSQNQTQPKSPPKQGSNNQIKDNMPSSPKSPVAEPPKAAADETVSMPELPQLPELKQEPKPEPAPAMPDLPPVAKATESQIQIPSLPTENKAQQEPSPPLPVAPPALSSEPSTLSPSITPPPPRDAMSEPQFGGTLNATQINSETVLEPTLPVNQGEILEHTNGGMIGSEEVIEAARQAVESAAVEPPHKRLESIGSQSLPEVAPAETPLSVSNEPLPPIELPPAPAPTQPLPGPSAPPVAPPMGPDPMQAFMQPHPPAAPAPSEAFSPPVNLGAMPMPPAPPMPAMPQNDGNLPPLPPLPGQPMPPQDPMQHQTVPAFMQNVPQSQNSWTQAADELAAKQSQADADRQAKIDERIGHYEQAVDRNRELSGQNPLNNPNGSGLPPVPPTQPS